MQSATHAARLLKLFTPAQPRWSVTRAAAQLGLSKSTVSRLLAALAREGLVAKDPATRLYTVGVGSYSVGVVYLVGLNVRAAALPVLEEVAFGLRETVYLGALGDGVAVYIDKILSPLALRVDSYLGVSIPLHATALGKALLSGQSDAYVEQVIARGLPRFTRRTITSAAALWDEIQQVRRRGFATDFEEYEDGLHCVGFPIRDPTGKVPWAFSVAGPSVRLSRQAIERSLPRLRQAVRQIEERLGVGPGAGDAVPFRSQS
jgi:IclR family KDG regulon transcriptional repressor